MSRPPCNYRAGKTFGSGTYAIVKEVIHVKTGKVYACKKINKQRTKGHKAMILNEIDMLNRISGGTENMIILSDYFETSHNIYLCYNLCTGGDVFERICKQGSYIEGDAAVVVRSLCSDIAYIHSKGMVHRDLQPENLLLRTPASDSQVMIADFGLARELGKDDDGKTCLLTGVHGTPLYMAPEMYSITGYGKPVDIWALGVITYFLLAGRTPFKRRDKEAERRAILKGDFKFEPLKDWTHISQTAQDFIRRCLAFDPNERMTAEECLEHEWLASATPRFAHDLAKRAGNSSSLPLFPTST